jgi:hypothetical protein
MEIIRATLWIYQVAFKRTVESLAANWGIIFAPLAFGVILSVAATLAAPLGIIGGFIVTAATAACASSGLFLIDNIVRMGRVGLHHFTRGFSVRLWESRHRVHSLDSDDAAGGGRHSTPQGRHRFSVQLLLYIILNPVPELIYQTRTSGDALLSASYEFIVENWIEWFAPNVAIGVAAYWLMRWLDIPAAYLPVFFRFFFLFSVFGLLLTFLMIFRGLLFSELNGTTRRSRAYRYRARGD